MTQKGYCVGPGDLHLYNYGKNGEIMKGKQCILYEFIPCLLAKTNQKNKKKGGFQAQQDSMYSNWGKIEKKNSKDRIIKREVDQIITTLQGTVPRLALSLLAARPEKGNLVSSLRVPAWRGRN